MFELNIGLVTSNNHFGGYGVTLDYHWVLQQVRNLVGFDNVGDYRVTHSSTEKTLVLQVQGDTDSILRKVENLCNVLAQDCIAVFDTNRKGGYLVGPFAADWGSVFVAAYFIRLLPR